MTQPTAGQATRDKTTFRLEYAVATNIRATPEKIWTLLTTATDFPRWNSTVSNIEGTIAAGEKIKIRVPIAPNRVFSLKVSTFTPAKEMIWTDGAAPFFKGVRTYTLTPRPDGSTDFQMKEVFRGIMLPLIAGSLPDFRKTFEQYAADLKREAEK